jgi:hypothetical protein
LIQKTPAHADALNNRESSADKNRNGRNISNNYVNKADKLSDCFRIKHANVFVRHQHRTAILLPNGATQLLEQVRQTPTVGSFHFVKQLT